jgi:hypothetical protein
MRTTRVTVWRLFLAIGVTVGCGSVQEPEETAQKSDNLFGRTTYESSTDRYVPPFTGAYLDRSMFHARTVAAAPAFRQCVANTMYLQYMNCGDPGPSSSPPVPADRTGQINAAWSRFQSWDNSMSFGLRPSSDFPGAGASAGDETGANTYATHHVTVYGGYAADYPDWSWYAAPQPWNWRADDMIHEYTHTLGYVHNGDPAQEAACAAANNRASYYALGEPSVPYIYGGCADSLITESARVCGDIHTGCPAGQLRLLAGWGGTVQNAQAGACSCIEDPTHTIALRTNAGFAVTANGGGGDAIMTNWSTRIGAWQWFYFYVPNMPYGWQNNSGGYLKTFGGDFVRTVSGAFRGDQPVATPVWLGDGTASTHTIGDASVVSLSVGSLLSPGSLIGCDSGGQLLSVPAPGTGAACQLTIVEPRRDSLVYLRAWTGQYVNVDGAGVFWNRLTDADLGLPSAGVPASPATAATAAFWIIDWNGGTLNSGDWISFEAFENDSHLYMTVMDGDHTGQPHLANSMDTYERFQIIKQSGGSGAIGNNDDVALLSANGTYLTAMPSDYFPNQILNYGTYVGAWQHFQVVNVQQYDRPRSSW